MLAFNINKPTVRGTNLSCECMNELSRQVNVNSVDAYYSYCWCCCCLDAEDVNIIILLLLLFYYILFLFLFSFLLHLFV